MSHWLVWPVILALGQESHLAKDRRQNSRRWGKVVSERTNFFHEVWNEVLIDNRKPEATFGGKFFLSDQLPPHFSILKRTKIKFLTSCRVRETAITIPLIIFSEWAKDSPISRFRRLKWFSSSPTFFFADLWETTLKISRLDFLHLLVFHGIQALFEYSGLSWSSGILQFVKLDCSTKWNFRWILFTPFHPRYSLK